MQSLFKTEKNTKCPEKQLSKLFRPIIIHSNIFEHLRTGVSNTRPAGRMWPAKSVYVARVALQIQKVLKFFPQSAAS